MKEKIPINAILAFQVFSSSCKTNLKSIYIYIYIYISQKKQKKTKTKKKKKNQTKKPNKLLIINNK